MLLGWTRFHDLPFLGEEAFFTCRGRMLHIRTETFLGNRDRSKDRCGCGRTFSVIGADVEYIEFPGCNHGSWNPAFNYPDFMEWLFNQKKK